LYREVDIHERHRHRHEANPSWITTLEEVGLAFVGRDDKEVRMEVIELKDKNWFVGFQFNPEHFSRVLNPSRPYLGLIATCFGSLDQITAELSKGSKGVVNGVGKGGTVACGIGVPF
jgi:CTP synthase